MASYIVMSDSGDKPGDDIRFVQDGFAVIAFVVPIIWLLWHRLWLQAALCFGAMGAVAALAAWSGNPIWAGLAGMTSVSISLLVALEGGEWRRQSLEQQGYRELDVIPARSMHQAEELFASRMINVVERKPAKGFAPVSSASLIPLTGL